MASNHKEIIEKLKGIAHDINKHTSKHGWEENLEITKDLQVHIDKLMKYQDITIPVLQESNIGKVVKSLTKHCDSNISGYSKTLVQIWKSKVGIKPKKKKELSDARKGLQKSYRDLKEQKQARNITVLDNLPSKTGKNLSKTPPKSKKNGLVLSDPEVRNRKAELSRQQKHRRRQQILRERAVQSMRQSGITPLPLGPKESNDRSKSSTIKSRQPFMNSRNDSRKEMLNKLFPRIRGSPTEKVSESKSNRSENKKQELTSEQLQVQFFLKGLMVDMSEYTKQFLDMGYDSMKILATARNEDLEEIVSKKAHRRIIIEAIEKLKGGKRNTGKKRSRSIDDRKSYLDEYESDDSFIVNDDEEDIGYNPGIISSMFRKNRRAAYNDDMDESNSSDMEATYDEIQQEEARTAHLGRKEDFEEQKRNHIHEEKIRRRKDKKLKQS